MRFYKGQAHHTPHQFSPYIQVLTFLRRPLLSRIRQGRDLATVTLFFFVCNTSGRTLDGALIAFVVAVVVRVVEAAVLEMARPGLRRVVASRVILSGF